MIDEIELFNHRKDFRSPEEFVKCILTDDEKLYLLKWVEIHNKNRHKRALTIEHWGNKGNGKIYFNENKVNGYCKPDYVLNRCNDNDYFIKDKQPIEVQRCKTLNPVICYIKRSKIDWPFDSTTKEVCNKKMVLLFILGTDFKGSEKYALLRWDFLSELQKRNIEYPLCMGKKACYWFHRYEVKWKPLNYAKGQYSLDNIFRTLGGNK
jgi:hypothetical protein